MTRDSIIIYRSWYEAIKELDADVKVSLYEAIIHYGLNQEEPKLHGIAQVVWQLIKPNVDANYRKWENGQKGAQHGGKGGRPKKPQGNPTETPQVIQDETPSKPQRNPKRTPNVNVNVNENENVDENVKEQVSEIEWPAWAGPNVLKTWKEFKAYRLSTHRAKYKSSSTEQHAVNLAEQAAARAGGTWSRIQEWPELDDGYVVHAPVGTYAANGFGLHEVSGNLWEWCLDGLDDDFYARSPRLDPWAPWQGTPSRVLRGGSFTNGAGDARSARRESNTPLNAGLYLGVRPARAVGH